MWEFGIGSYFHPHRRKHHWFWEVRKVLNCSNIDMIIYKFEPCVLVVLSISFFSGRWAVDLVWQRRCVILSQLATCFSCTGDKFAVWTPFYFHSNIKVCGLAGQVGLAPDLARLGGVVSKVEPMCHLVGSKSRGQHLVLDLGIQPPAICCKCYCVGYPTHLTVPEVYRPRFIQPANYTNTWSLSSNCGIFQILGFAKMLTVKYCSL